MSRTGPGDADELISLFSLGCFAILTGLALGEQFSALPGAVVALVASGWIVTRS